MRRMTRILTAAALAAAVVVGGAACSLGGNSDVPVATDAPPTGADGAVNFDGRYISAGTGSTKVDLWFDPMCPGCGQFERLNGETLAAAVAGDAITLRLHPLSFLDRYSNGTAYSSRAVAALTCVAVHDPDKALDYFRALYEDQPEEGSNGLTDDELATRATDLGITDISGCIERSGPYQAWAQANTAHSQSGPIEVDGKKVLDSIESTPTVLVNGKPFTGDADALKKLLGE